MPISSSFQSRGGIEKSSTDVLQTSSPIRGQDPPGRTCGNGLNVPADYEVIVRPLAELDLDSAQRWYEHQRAGLGDEFRDAVDQLLIRLSETPLIYPVVHRRIHRAVLQRFPYLVYFTVTGNSVSVLACLHGGRGPRLARTRTR